MNKQQARTWLRVVHVGFRDGWEQPRELTASANLEALLGDDLDEDRHYELQNRAINLGQLLRAGRGSEPWREGWWPVKRLRAQKGAK